MEGILEEKTYEIYVLNKGAYERIQLQVINEKLVIDLETRQLFYGTIEEYLLMYSGYDSIESIEEKDISCTRKLAIINCCPILH